jgi:lysyl-tRNA synthetase class II
MLEITESQCIIYSSKHCKMAGLNTEIKRKQADYHVQTEDKGHGINHVETVIYKSGKILSSRKSSYTSFLNHPNLKQKVQQMIEKQHKECLKEIDDGKFDHL